MRKSRKPASADHPPVAPMPAPLSRIVRVDEIKDGEELAIEASAAERTAIAALLDLAALDRLSLAGTVQKTRRRTPPVAGHARCLSHPDLRRLARAGCKRHRGSRRGRVLASASGRGTAAERRRGREQRPARIGRSRSSRARSTSAASSTRRSRPRSIPIREPPGVNFEWQEPRPEQAAEDKPESPFAALASLKRG